MLITGFKRFHNLLITPFPGNCEPIIQLRNFFWIGAFVGVFLYFFEPYGIDNYNGNLIILSAMFGLATWVGGMAYFFTTTYIFKVQQEAPDWVLWKWIIYSLGIIVVITLCNAMVNWLLSDGQSELSFLRIADLLGKTLAIGIFPITLSGITLFYRNRNSFLHQAAKISQDVDHRSAKHSDQLIRIPSQYAEEFNCTINDLYAIEAQDNYVAVKHYVNGVIQSTLIRNSLANIEASLPSNIFFRCHRSFIANLDKINEVSGNAQGLVLKLSDHNLLVPVSRKYIPKLKKLISH